MKEWKGIVFGCIAFFVVPIVIFCSFSKESARSRTEPVFSEVIESPVFREEKFNRIIRELDIAKLNGFLFLGHPRRSIYAPIFIGKSPKGATAVRNCFPQVRQVEADRVESEVSALALSGGEKPETLYDASGNGRDGIYFCGDSVILAPEPRTTSVFLDEPQMKHFLHRYLSGK